MMGFSRDALTPRNVSFGSARPSVRCPLRIQLSWRAAQRLLDVFQAFNLEK